jgi:hypothetical protein
MGETEPGPTFVSYRDRITALMEADEPFGAVEDANAALWLLVFSMRDPGEQRQNARARLHALA